VILAIFIAWAVSGIVTAAGGFPEGSQARTDTRLDVLNEAQWIRVPYPGIKQTALVCFPIKIKFKRT